MFGLVRVLLAEQPLDVRVLIRSCSIRVRFCWSACCNLLDDGEGDGEGEGMGGGNFSKDLDRAVQGF